MILGSLNTSVMIKMGNYIPHDIWNNLLNNINTLTQSGKFMQAFLNSSVIAIFTTILTIILATILNYIFINNKQNYLVKKMINIVLFCIAIPSTACIIPLFTILNQLSLLDSILTVIVVGMPISIILYLIIQNSTNFPTELILAARLDDVSELKIFFNIYIKGLMSPIISGIVLTFLTAWNNLMLPLIVLQTGNKITLPVFLASLDSSTNPNLAVIMLSLLLTSLPAIIIFLIFQKQFKKGFNL